MPSPSFAKALYLGEIHEDMVFPYPRMDREEQRTIEHLISDLREWARRSYDPARVEAEGWVGDDTIAALGEMGLCGLYVDPAYGGLGLSQTGYARVFEAIGQIDATLGVVLGVHQSIGYKGIHLFGTEEQKERFLPDLARGKKLAGFALTEPNAGSDAYHIETVANPQPDGSYILEGEKRWIGNGSKDVLVTFARTPEGAHVALIVERGMEGFEVGHAYETMGLRGNDLRHLRFRGVRVPPENVLGTEGDGFRIAVEVLNNGRLSLGSACVGAARRLVDLAIDHTQHRHQFGSSLSDFELVQDKIGWISSYTYGLESMAYLTTGMVDRGTEDISVESAMVKIAGTEFLWYAANRVFQLAGGTAYMRDEPYEKILRDIRIFPIFEGSNDVLRLFVALSGLEPLGEELSEMGDLDLKDPIGTIGNVASYLGDRIRRQVSPAGLEQAHPGLRGHAKAVGTSVSRLRSVSERALRQHGRDIRHRQMQLKRLSHAGIDLFAQIATISRVSDVLERLGPEMLGDEIYIAETFCQRAAHRVERWLNQIDENDDDRIISIAKAAYERSEYRHTI